MPDAKPIVPPDYANEIVVRRSGSGVWRHYLRECGVSVRGLRLFINLRRTPEQISQVLFGITPEGVNAAAAFLKEHPNAT